MKWIKKIGALITPKTIKGASNVVGKISDNKQKTNTIKLIIVIIGLLLLGYGAIENDVFKLLLEYFA
jgi:hypothetical protein